MCGGTSDITLALASLYGLSPRVRGNLAYINGSWKRWRSIPACAGEPRSPTNCASNGTVYPRVCGGTQISVDLDSGAWGLSPRVRGNLWSGYRWLSGVGSIPACAGEPAARLAGIPVAGVYPRVCGGTCSWSVSPPSCKGLSPRVRGNPGPGTIIDGMNRSIPACAGEPCTPRGMRLPATVYPRVCGGTYLTHISRISHAGLSPRVRGNRSGVAAPAIRGGSIPACAGEPHYDRRTTPANTVYPRVCGGTWVKS